MLAALAVGLVFGAVMQAGVTYRCDCSLDGTPWRQSVLPRAILMALGVGVILIYGGHAAGLLQFHVKAFYPVGIALGAILFGAGVAILGFCPGTLPIALASRRIEALAGLLGGVLAGGAFTAVAAPYAASVWHGPTFAVQRIGPALGLGGGAELVLAVVIGAALVLAALWIGRTRRPV
ncbi:MAG TPA: YeeE/YedE thiosulfate transporter family protein [Acetobacteraceae bacterium]|nr:YeeE/YedE thiosulfate transporter family protein [Acetobacteraceae bacterium]